MSNQTITTTTYGTRTFISAEVQQDFDQVRASTFFWKAQPDWPEDDIKFTIPDRTDRRKLIEALMDQQSSPELQDIGYALLTCKKTDRCKSPLCNYCRSRLQSNYQAQVRKKFAAFAKQDIYFLTLLDDLTDTPLQTIPPWITNQRSVLNEVFGHHFKKQISVFGAFEVDVKHPSLFHNNNAKLDLLKEYGLPDENAVAWMPHFHGIIGLDGITADDFRKKMRSRFSKRKQVTLTSLWSDQTKNEALNAIAWYCFKFKYKYAVNLGSSDLSENETASNYDKRFNDDVLRIYTELIHNIRGPRTVQGLIYQWNILKS